MSVLGQGTFETVYAINEWQILKVPKRDLLTDPHALLELAISRVLTHPNARKLMSCRTVLDQQGRVIPLKAYRRRRPLSDFFGVVSTDVFVRKYVLYQITRLVASLHKMGIVHGDLKTGNIMAYALERGRFACTATNGPTPNPTIIVEVSDFGSCLLQKRRSMGVTTSDFRAPECCVPGYLTSPALDMWSLGMVTMDLLGVHHLASAATEEGYFEVLRNVHGITFGPRGSIEIDTGVRDQLWQLMCSATNDDAEVDFVMRCLEPVTSERLTAHQAIHHRFFTQVARMVDTDMRMCARDVDTFDHVLTRPGEVHVPQDWWKRICSVFRSLCPPCPLRTIWMAADMAYRARSRAIGVCRQTMINADDAYPIAYGAAMLACAMLEFGTPYVISDNPPIYEAARRGARWLLIALDGGLVNPRATVTNNADMLPDTVDIMNWNYTIQQL